MNLNRTRRFLERVYLLEVARELRAVPRKLKRDLKRGFGRLDSRLLESYLRQHDVTKLQLGCGSRQLEGWLNTDIIPRSAYVMRLDATRPMPMGENVFDFVYSEHMIEHISFENGQKMLAECFRILNPGGTIRTVTPNLSFLIGTYQGQDQESISGYLQYYRDAATPWAPSHSPVFFVNNFVRDWGHQFIYDEETLRTSLESAGFVDIVSRELNDSAHEELRGLASVSRMPDGYLDLESFTLEAAKPESS